MSETILGKNEEELLRVLSNPENFLISDDLQDRLNLDVQEALDANLESNFVILLDVGDTKLTCPLLSYSKSNEHYGISFLISEEQVPYLFNFEKDMTVKMVAQNALILKEFIMTSTSELEMTFSQEGYVKVKVRLYQNT